MIQYFELISRFLSLCLEFTMEKYIFWAGCGRMGRDFTKNAVFLHWAQKRAAIFYQSFARTWFHPAGRPSTIKPSQASKSEWPARRAAALPQGRAPYWVHVEERKEFWYEELQVFPPQLPEGRRRRFCGQPGSCKRRRCFRCRAQGPRR